jgi:hypothetical protein
MRVRAVLPALLAAVGGVLIWRRRRAAARPARLVTPVPPATALIPVPRFVSVPWQLAAEPGDDEDELSISYARDEHMAPDRIDVLETPTQVFVTVIVSWLPPAGGWFAWREQEQATVQLRAPLAGRELIHAATDLDDGAAPQV